MSVPGTVSFARVAACVAVVLLATFAGGCGSQYRVVRSDPSVQLDASEWVVLPTVDPGPLSADVLEDALAAELSSRWDGHSLARGEAVANGYGLRVTVADIAEEDDRRTRVLARVELVGPDGRSPDAFETEVRADGPEGVGRALADRIATYVRDRHAHHH